MYIFIAILLPIINASGQILMKQAALKKLNRKMMYIYLCSAYGLFLVSTILTIYILKYISMKYFTIILAFNFIVTGLFSFLFLKEKMGKKTLLGTIVVLIGVGIFSYK
ncbi:EamA family transporter [Metasolibacillus meyeri]|uniref:EamA family transporter n=1 Tax=Metasolibacillus meyeri TaxID=1071052 RepID=UPI000D2F8A7A